MIKRTLKVTWDFIFLYATLLFCLVKMISRTVPTVCVAIIIVLGLAIPTLSVVVNVDAIRSIYISALTEDSTFLIRNYRPDGGYASGSGFHVKDENGVARFITNAHVCDIGHPPKLTAYNTASGKMYNVKFIKYSYKADICEMSIVPDAPALSLTGDLFRGQQIFVAGHPAGYNLFVSSGLVIDLSENIDTYSSRVIGMKTCNKYGGKNIQIPVFDGFLFNMKWVCVQKYNTIQTSALIIEGSSGSPVVDIWGKVIGILHKKNKANWGLAVPAQKIYDFINGKEK